VTGQHEQVIDTWILEILEEHPTQPKRAGAIAVELGLPTASAERALRRLLAAGRVRLAAHDPERWTLAPATPQVAMTNPQVAPGPNTARAKRRSRPGIRSTE
jgi:hypothetical protein